MKPVKRSEAFELLKDKIRYEDTQKTVEGSAVLGETLFAVRCDPFDGYKHFMDEHTTGRVAGLDYSESFDITMEYAKRTGRNVGLPSLRRIQFEASLAARDPNRNKKPLWDVLYNGQYSTLLSGLIVKVKTDEEFPVLKTSIAHGHKRIRFMWKPAKYYPRPSAFNNGNVEGKSVYAYIDTKKFPDTLTKNGLLNSTEGGDIGKVWLADEGIYFSYGISAMSASFIYTQSHGDEYLRLSSRRPDYRSDNQVLVLAEIDERFEYPTDRKVTEFGETFHIKPFIQQKLEA